MTAQVFLAHQLEELAKVYDVTLVANFQGQADTQSWLPNEIVTVDIPIQRTITPWSDVRCFFKLKNLFRENKYTLVHSVSPKAGMLSMLAARCAKVPVRIHTFTGQVWATKKGLKRVILKTLDKVTAACATNILVDSHTQRAFLITHNVVPDSKSKVLCDGSISGVDCDRFKANVQTRAEIRASVGTIDSSIVMLFMGRLKKDKGVLDLVEAFSKAKTTCPEMELWLVGPDEEGIQQKIGQREGITYVPFTNTPQEFMASADVLCLPSYREGFGSVVLEASACEIPSIGSDIYGLQDAIVDGETGILVQPHSVDALSVAMVYLAQDSSLRERMGKSARSRVLDKFSHRRLTEAVLSKYEELLNLPEP